MKKIFFFYFLLLVAAACSSPVSQESAEESLQYAEALLERGDNAAAIDAVASLADTASFSRLSIEQLGRLSMIFMQVSENIDQATNVGSATDIYDYVYRVNADSAAMFYDSIEPAQMQFVETMRHSSVARRAPMDISSIPSDTYIEVDSLIGVDSLEIKDQSLETAE